MKHLNIKHRTPAVVFLKIHTYVGSETVYWATHWQGSLFCGEDREGIEVRFTLTQADADAANKDNGPYADPEDVGSVHPHYEAGETSTRFTSKERLLEETLARWQKHWPEASVLIEGEPNVIEPQPILVGPEEIKERVNALAVQCEDLGWWDGGNEEAVEELAAEWERIWKYQIEPLAKKTRKPKAGAKP